MTHTNGKMGLCQIFNSLMRELTEWWNWFQEHSRDCVQHTEREKYAGMRLLD